MNTLPHTPVTYTTRQLTCVSCQERFAVAEDLMMANQAPGWNGHLPTQAETVPLGITATLLPNRSAHGPSGKWRLPNDKTEAISLREQEIWFQRSVTPQKRAEPLPTPFHAYSYEQSDDTYLNCPRCGADNRNWAQLMAQPASLQTWLRRFPLASWGMVVAGAIAVSTGYVVWAWDISVWHIGLLLLAILVAGILPCLWLTGYWEILRHTGNLETVQPNSRFQEEMILWSQGLAYICLVALVVPFLFFEAGPRSFDYALIRLGVERPAAEANEAETAGSEVESSGTDINAAPPYDTPHVYMLQQLLIRYPWLAGLLVETQPEAAPSLPPPPAPRIPLLGAGLRYLTMWVATVGLSALFAVTVALTAAGQFAARTNEHLPAPIFHSVAHLSRVVMWEAKRALKINGDLSQIQWMRVERNSQGGIDLIGLHRERPEVENGRFSATVRAQRYTIHSDIWGRIVHTDVRDVTVPRSIIHQTGIEINEHQQEHRGVFNPLFVGHQ